MVRIVRFRCSTLQVETITTPHPYLIDCPVRIEGKRDSRISSDSGLEVRRTPNCVVVIIVYDKRIHAHWIWFCLGRYYSDVSHWQPDFFIRLLFSRVYTRILACPFQSIQNTFHFPPPIHRRPRAACRRSLPSRLNH
jgi:hypothetical protein